jgi:hypothetical protein
MRGVIMLKRKRRTFRPAHSRERQGETLDRALPVPRWRGWVFGPGQGPRLVPFILLPPDLGHRQPGGYRLPIWPVDLLFRLPGLRGTCIGALFLLRQLCGVCRLDAGAATLEGGSLLVGGHARGLVVGQCP